MGEQGRSAQSSPQACPARRPRLNAEETAPSLPVALGGAGWAIPHTGPTIQSVYCKVSYFYFEKKYDVLVAVIQSAVLRTLLNEVSLIAACRKKSGFTFPIFDFDFPKKKNRFVPNLDIVRRSETNN